jgi:hypothetical protein
MNHLNKATEVANVWGTETRAVHLQDWLQQVCPAGIPKKNRKALMPHGNFSQRSAAGCWTHSGIIQIDIDAKENPALHNWEAVRDLLGQQPHVLCSSISASGAGIFALVRIHEGCDMSHWTVDEKKDKHRQWAAAAMGYVEDIFSEEMKVEVVIDRRVSNNLASLRFQASDAEAFINVDAEPLHTLAQ